VPYSGIVLGDDGKVLSGETGVTFQIYKDEQGGQALWTETQTVALDPTGHYKTQLGATDPNGLPSDLFSTGEARWLEVQVAGQAPQPRVLLASVPYALKAADATTLGGLPASAYALAGANAVPNAAPTAPDCPKPASVVTSPGGTANKLAKFAGAESIVDSLIFDNGTNVGIGTTKPAEKLDVNGESLLRGDTTLYRSGDATARRPAPLALRLASTVRVPVRRERAFKA
jgi:hypothetical protein